jgi:hypothetical protein
MISAEEKKSAIILEDVLISIKSMFCKPEDRCEYYVDNVKIKVEEEINEMLVVSVSYDYST